MYKRARREYTPLIFVIAVVFSIGLVLGSVAYFSIDKSISDELNNLMLNGGQTYSFLQMFKKSFLSESLWVTIAWIIAQIGFMVPFSCTVIGIRGFVMGFTVSFVLQAGDMAVNVLISNVIPQCVFGVPFLSMVILISIFNALDERKTNSSQLKSFFIELFALTGAAIVAVLECLCRSVL